jgi:hypothetical protein
VCRALEAEWRKGAADVISEIEKYRGTFESEIFFFPEVRSPILTVAEGVPGWRQRHV